MRFIEKGLLSGKLTQRLITAGGVIIALAVMLSLLPLSAASAAEVPDNIATNITLTDPVTGNEVSEVQARGKYQLILTLKYRMALIQAIRVPSLCLMNSSIRRKNCHLM